MAFHTPPKFRRRELLRKNQIPSRNEVEYFSGPALAQVFSEFGHPDVKTYLAENPPLDEAQGELWISPSDQLIGKVRLKPPLTRRHIKACTHEGILELGERRRKQWETDTEEKLRLRLANTPQDLRLLCAAEKRHALDLCTKKLEQKYREDIALLSQQHAQDLQAARADTLVQCYKSQQFAIVEERMHTSRQMSKKLKDEVGYVVVDLCDEFQRKLQAEKENMIADFNKIMRHERAKVENRMTAIKQQNAEDLASLRMQIEVQHITEIIMLIALERAESKSEKDSLRQCHYKKIRGLEDCLIEAMNNIQLLNNEEKNVKSTPEFVWREKYQEIIQQFQKFINYAFKAVPGQAEYLLSLQSLLEREEEEEQTATEQKQTICRRPGREAFRVVEIVDQDGEKWRPIQLIPQVPHLYCTDKQLVPPIIPSQTSLCQGNDNESHSYCSLRDNLFIRSDCKPDEDSAEMKTMQELSAGKFKMQLNDFSPCNELLKDFRDGPLANNEPVPIRQSAKASPSLQSTGEEATNLMTPEEFFCARVASLDKIVSSPN